MSKRNSARVLKYGKHNTINYIQIMTRTFLVMNETLTTVTYSDASTVPHITQVMKTILHLRHNK